MLFKLLIIFQICFRAFCFTADNHRISPYERTPDAHANLQVSFQLQWQQHHPLNYRNVSRLTHTQ
jgi:hypothetical protein